MASVDQPAAKVPRRATNFRLCLICPEETSEELVNLPSSHNTLLHYVKERASFGEKQYCEISRRIGDTMEERLISEGATWHRKCYSATCNSTMCKRRKKCYEKLINAKSTFSISDRSFAFCFQIHLLTVTAL